MSVGTDHGEIFQFLRSLQSTNPIPLAFRDNRPYMLAESAKYDPTTQQLQVVGFLKGNCINANQLVHITGIDDF